MRQNRPSRTSSLVAMVRALANEGVTEVRDFHDPTAMILIPQPWQWLARRSARRMRVPARRERALADGRMDIVPLRTRWLDEAWHEAHRLGIRQLVLLGAGLDGRAFRLEDIGDTAVFEIDHPATQALKRKRATGLRPLAERHAFVPIDFESNDLVDVLGTRLTRKAPTFWIWEGVTTYLSREAQQATLKTVSTLSAAGSRLAFTYVEPKLTTGGERFTRRIVGLLGEPFVGYLSRGDAARLATEAGFSVISDTSPREWRRVHSVNPDRITRDFPGRIAIAEKVS
jgi:methyltransferase (TIGR00027 family)